MNMYKTIIVISQTNLLVYDIPDLRRAGLVIRMTDFDYITRDINHSGFSHILAHLLT